MKKYIVFFIACLTAQLQSYGQTSPKEWTIMVYLNVDNNLEEFGLQDFMEMSKVGTTPLVNVVVQLDRSKNYSTEHGDWSGTYRFKVEKGMKPTSANKVADLGEVNMGDPRKLVDFISWTKQNYPAKKYFLILSGHGNGWKTKGMQNNDPEYIKAASEEFEKNIFQIKDLANQHLFVKSEANVVASHKIITSRNASRWELIKVYPRMKEIMPNFIIPQTHSKDSLQHASEILKRTMMVGFGHLNSGNYQFLKTSSFHLTTYLSSLMSLDSIALKNNLLNVEVNARVNAEIDTLKDVFDVTSQKIIVDSPTKAVSSDDTDKDILYTKEMQDAISDNEVDVIGFDACLMSMIETAHALRNKARYMVASEEVEPGTGWNYKVLLEQINQNPAMEGVEMAKVIVKAFNMAYPHEGNVTLSAIELRYLDELAKATDSLSNLLIANMNVERSNIFRARDLCMKYALEVASIHSIDYRLFLYQLSRLSVDEAIVNLSVKIMTMIDLIVVARFVGEDMSFVEGQPCFGSFGIAIYFPTSKKMMDKHYTNENQNFPVEFVSKHKWDDFLAAYFR